MSTQSRTGNANAEGLFDITCKPLVKELGRVLSGSIRSSDKIICS